MHSELLFLFDHILLFLIEIKKKKTQWSMVEIILRAVEIEATLIFCPASY